MAGITYNVIVDGNPTGTPTADKASALAQYNSIRDSRGFTTSVEFVAQRVIASVSLGIVERKPRVIKARKAKTDSAKAPAPASV